MEKIMDALQTLSRSEMKEITGGYIMDRCVCYNGDCRVTLTQTSSGWTLETCDDEWTGSGQYGGTVCGGQCPM